MTMLNFLDKGRVGSTTERKKTAGRQLAADPLISLAQKQALDVALREATRLVRARRGLGLTGAQAVGRLLQVEPLDVYGCRYAPREVHVELRASEIDEPNRPRTVHMLDCLPAEEAAYYSLEANVVEPAGKSQVVFNEVEDRYGYIGGSEAEYLAYFHRPDLPHNLWAWTHPDDVKAVAGFAVVAKKSGKLRKLLMQCAANYMWQDLRDRQHHGLYGGAALAAAHVPGDCIEAAGFDESNAFTAVEVPDWMSFWVCAPPLRAISVWSLLPKDLRDRVLPGHYVFPRYTRLAMGSSHSVHILMAINIQRIGEVLTSSRRLGLPGVATVADPSEEESAESGDDDEKWVVTQQRRRLQEVEPIPSLVPEDFPCSGSHMSVEAFIEAIRLFR